MRLTVTKLNKDVSNFRRAQRVSGLNVSEIVQISEQANEMRSQGRDIISFGTGEPDFPTPSHVIEAAHTAAIAGETRYPPTAGKLDLRQEIAAQFQLSVANVIVSTGAKQVIANAFLATLDPGDEVIIPAPYWTTYSDIVQMCDARPVIIKCAMANQFKLSPEALGQAITPRSRWLMLNSPCNPSGAVYSKEELRALGKVLKQHPHIWVLSDEIYEHLCFSSFASFVSAVPELSDRVLTVNGASKAWAMTGWRIGWGVGPKSLIKAMIAVQGQITSGACSIAQAAALAALTGDPALLTERRRILKARRDTVVAALNAMSALVCDQPDGAFYVFPSCAALLAHSGGPFEDASAFCGWLLDKAGVALVPGSAFGFPGHFRLSFAYSDADLSEGLSRMNDVLKRMP